MTWNSFQRPIVCLAPMDGITNTAYRQIVRKLNKNVILFSEFTNVDGLIRSEHVRKRLEYTEEEHPFFIQLFGNKPDSFAEAARMVEDRGIMGIDINMGCPAKKIVSSQHGSALMKDVDKAREIVDAVRKACTLEVSVKTRLGWENADGLIPFGKSLESAGISLLTIHGRTYKQGFKGNADWEPIYELKRNLDIPVLGNGDVVDHRDGLQKMKNLDGFMIGRSAIGNPWVFQDSQKYESPSLAERIDIAIEHYHLFRKLKPEHIAVREFRRYLKEYVQGFRNAKEWRGYLMESVNESEFLERMRKVQVLDTVQLSQAS